MFMLDLIDGKNDVNDKGKGHIYLDLSVCLSNEEAPSTPTTKKSLLESLEMATLTKRKIGKDMMEPRVKNKICYSRTFPVLKMNTMM